MNKEESFEEWKKEQNIFFKHNVKNHEQERLMQKAFYGAEKIQRDKYEAFIKKEHERFTNAKKDLQGIAIEQYTKCYELTQCIEELLEGLRYYAEIKMSGDRARKLLEKYDT